MYFAVQGLVTQVAGAIAVNLIYMNLIASPMEVLGKDRTLKRIKTAMEFKA